MGKPTFDLCYSEEVLRANMSGRHTPVHGKREAVRLLGDKLRRPEIFGLAEIKRRYLFPNKIGNKSEPGELKHLSTRRKGHQRDSVSSGERTRIRPMLLFLITRTGWKAGPQRVTAPYG